MKTYMLSCNANFNTNKLKKNISLSIGKLKNTSKPEQKQSHELKPGIIVLEKNKDIRKQHMAVPEMMLSSDVSYITQFFLIFLGEWLHRSGNT